MDFTFNEAQEAVAEAAASIFNGLVTPDRVAEVEATEDRCDQQLWRQLAEAGLLSLSLPEQLGGEGLGLLETCLLLEAQGRVVAPIPLHATLVLGAWPVVKFGTPEQQLRYLAGVGDGSTRATAALTEIALSTTGRPAVVATDHESGYKLTGTAAAVPHAHLAGFMLIPAVTAAGDTIVAIVEPNLAGVTLERAVTTNREVHPNVLLHDVVVGDSEILAGPDRGAAVVAAMLEAAMAGLAVISVGAGEAAIAQTAAYLNEREQFGRPLSTFQGTMLRLADAAIDLEAIRVTAWNAAWLIDEGFDAAEAVRVAKWQASERGQRVVHATQHLHGGMGADISYPMHRYFLWCKQIELMLGGPSIQLAALGAILAARPVGAGGR